VIPREGVERNPGHREAGRGASRDKVIPREGVERVDQSESNIGWLVLVIPREGVESSSHLYGE